MITFLFALNLIVILVLYTYLYVIKKEGYSECRHKYLILIGYTVTVNLIFFNMFYLDTIYDRFGHLSGLVIPVCLIFILTGYVTKKYAKGNVVISIPFALLKVLNTVVFIPMTIVYLLHNKSIEVIYTWVILIPVSLVIVYGVNYLLIRKSTNNVMIKISSYSFIPLVYIFTFLPIFTLNSSNEYLNYFDSEEYSETSTDKAILHIASFESDLTSEEIRDYVYKDNYLYYVTTSKSEKTIHLSIYSMESNEIVYQHESKESGEDNRWLWKEDQFLLDYNNHLYFLTGTGLYVVENNELTLISSATIYDSYFFKSDDSYYIASIGGENELNSYQLIDDTVQFQTNIQENGYSRNYYEKSDYLLYYDKEDNSINLSSGITYELPDIEKKFLVHAVTDEFLIIEEYSSDDNTKDYFYKIDRDNEFQKMSSNEMDIFFEYSVHNDLIYPSTSLPSHATESLKLCDSSLKIKEKYDLRNSSSNPEKNRVLYMVRFFDDKMYFTSSVVEGEKLYIEFSTFEDIDSTVSYKYFEHISAITIYLNIIIVFVPVNSLRKKKNDDIESELTNEFSFEEVDENSDNKD